jgi:hypothetical protein
MGRDRRGRPRVVPRVRRRQCPAVHCRSVGLDDDVAEIYADAKLEALIRRHAHIPRAHSTLNLDRAAHRVDDAIEGRQHPIAGVFDDVAVMRGDLRIDEFATACLEARMRSLLVDAHQPAVAGDISGQYCD